jgi:tetratricopeptide (TPR) repeat protein
MLSRQVTAVATGLWRGILGLAGEALSALGAGSLVIALYRRRLARHPERRAEILFDIGCVHADAGALEDAIQDFRNALSSGPSDPGPIYVELGHALEQDSRILEAIDAYERAASSKTDWSDKFRQELVSRIAAVRLRLPAA